MKLLSAALLFLLAGMAMAQPEPAGLRKEMERFYDKWDRAMERGSLRSVMHMIDNDFYMVDQQGKRSDLNQFEDKIGSMSRSKDFNLSTTILHVRQSANEAIVWLKCVASWDPGNKTKTTRQAHTLRKTADGWKVYYVQMLPDNETWGPPPSRR